MIYFESKDLQKHFRLNEFYIHIETRLSLEDNFNILEQIEFYIRTQFNIDTSSLYKRVLNRLRNKNGTIEITPKINGKLYEFYKIIHTIYEKEYTHFNYSWNINKPNMTQGDVPFLLRNKNSQIISTLKQEKDEIFKVLQSSKNIKDFLNNMKLKNTNIELVF